MKKVLAIFVAITMILTNAFASNKVNAHGYEDVVFLGDCEVDKAPIIRYISNNHQNSMFKNTVNHSFTEVGIVGSDSRFHKLRIIEISGQNNYKGQIPLFMRGSKVAVIVCSYDNIDSFKSVADWIRIVKEYNQDCRIIIVVNHVEIVPSQRVFNISDAYDVNGADDVLEVSSQTGLGINELEMAITDQCNLYDQKIEKFCIVDISDTHDKETKRKKGCC